jgi:sulfur transfer complex TusBCD TusB component (DsrH family)
MSIETIRWIIYDLRRVGKDSYAIAEDLEARGCTIHNLVAFILFYQE